MSEVQAHLHSRDAFSGQPNSPGTPVMAVSALQHMTTKSSLDRSCSEGAAYLHSEVVFFDDEASPGADTMDGTAHVADTFYSQAGQQDLVDTGVFPAVSASSRPVSSKKGISVCILRSPGFTSCRVLQSTQDPVPLRGGSIHLTGTRNGGGGSMSNYHTRSSY